MLYRFGPYALDEERLTLRRGPFGKQICEHHLSSDWVDLAPSPDPVVLDARVSGSSLGALYRWRARVLYAPVAVTQPGVTPPPNPRAGRWRRVQAPPFDATVRVVPEPGRVAAMAGLLLLRALARRRSQRRMY